MPFYNVTGLVSSLNKPAKPEHVIVKAKDKEDAKKQATNKIQKKHPNGSVQIGSVRDPKP
ncbi:hypothetical protein ACIQVO_37235 [Streptomyces sp. NPDC101062]|uniref:hypothetical protein n=1 Tax=unclassified Streptomyces TaxID=2593676 RepID=UPI002E767DD5|nr:hypothetical protein [Streptomyces sp. JV176]MEE1798122.1 hypothetical protein [Streptomyces sp. JV176]